jgi:hypothetical protein
LKNWRIGSFILLILRFIEFLDYGSPTKETKRTNIVCIKLEKDGSKRINGYEELRVLGSGSFGKVKLFMHCKFLLLKKQTLKNLTQ